MDVWRYTESLRAADGTGQDDVRKMDARLYRTAWQDSPPPLAPSSSESPRP